MALLAGVTAFQWIMAAFTIASVVYQQQRQKKLAAAAAAAADAQKGFQVTTEGEISSLSVYYGRNKTGGTRVFHKVSGNYNYAPPATTGVAFTSYGDARTQTEVETQVQIYGASMFVDIDGVPTTVAISGVNLDSTLTATTLTVNLYTDKFNPYIIAQSELANGYITLQHQPIVSYSDGTRNTTVTSANYRIKAYTTDTHILEVYLPSAVLALSNTGMNSSIANTKNEFLFIQQAIGYKGISAVYCMDINEVDYRDESFGDSSRVHVYLAGNVADPMMGSNFSARNQALFPEAAYASGVFRLNRDAPQYNGIPSLTFYIEGMGVAPVIESSGAIGNTYSLGNKRYSNNSAECLLDYLMNADYGRGLTADQIDLESFYKAARICGIVVPVAGTLTDTSLQGKLWTEKGKTVQKTIKLYECNMGVDTTKSIRDNIDILLETMGRAELVWSSGKYKLQLEYPMEFGAAHITAINITGEGAARALVYGSGVYNKGDVVQYPPGSDSAVDLYESTVDNNSSTPDGDNNLQWSRTVIAAYITDDDIVVDEKVTQAWPSSQDKLNYYTVTFSNEAKDFAQDSVSWPPKFTPGGVYETYLKEDNGIELEGTTFQTGDSTYYNALATAEEKVRSSRAMSTYSIGVNIKYSNLEPGDLISVTSEIMGIGGELMQVQEIKVDDHNVAVVTAAKYDARNLAWNAKDDQVVAQRNIYDTDIGQASNLIFSASALVNGFSSGVISWNLAQDTRVKRYSVKLSSLAISQVDESTVWTEIGSTDGQSLDIPYLKAGSYTIAVVSVDGNGVLAPFYNIKSGSRWPMISAAATISAVGVSVAPLTLYKRSNSVLTVAPVNPTMPYGGTYNFVTSEQTQIPDGWYPFIPEGTAALYISQCKATVQYPQIIDDTLDWSVPVLFTANGSSSHTLTAYTRGNAQVPPVGGSFTFPNGATGFPYGVPPTSPDGVVWSMTIPDSTGSSLVYTSIALATLPGTEGINTNDLVWSQPAVLVSPANLTATVYLYKWSTVTETGPTTGTTDYAWVDGSQSNLTVNNGWSISVPANDGTPLLKLYQAKKNIVAGAGTSISTIDWSKDFIIEQGAQNGTVGYQVGYATVKQWAPTIPVAPAGPFTYTWLDGSVSSVPDGWLIDPGEAPSSSLTMYSAVVRMYDSTANLTSDSDWGLSAITAIAYSGVAGSDGVAGAQGSSARVCYTKTTLASLASQPTTIVVATDAIPPLNSWGAGVNWSFLPGALVAGQFLYQSNGIYNPTTDKTTWYAPYLSNLKVGNLSAITVNTGDLNISGTIKSANGNFIVDSLGAVTAKAITITDAAGNVVLASGASGIDYSVVLGTKPPANATYGSDSSNTNISLVTGNMLTNSAPFSIATMNQTYGWFPTNSSGGAFIGGNINDYGLTTWHPNGFGSVFCSWAGTPDINQLLVIYYIKQQPCVAGQRYQASAYMSSHRCSGSVNIQFCDINGNEIDNGSSATVTDSPGNTTPVSSWPRPFVFRVAPANACFVVMRCFGNTRGPTSDGSGDNPYIFTSGWYLGQALPAQTVPTPWADGTGAAFGVNVSGQITAATASTYIANAAIANAQIGNAAINLANINVATIGVLSALTANVGLLRTATIGGRQEISANYRKIFNDQGTLVMQDGDLTA